MLCAHGCHATNSPKFVLPSFSFGAVWRALIGAAPAKSGTQRNIVSTVAWRPDWLRFLASGGMSVRPLGGVTGRSEQEA